MTNLKNKMQNSVSDDKPLEIGKTIETCNGNCEICNNGCFDDYEE